jgi:basic membrane protein A
VLADGSAHGGQTLRIGLVLEQPLVGRADDPYQHGAYLGLLRATRTLNVQGKVVAPKPGGSYGAPMSYLARQRYDLVIAIGSLERFDLDVVALRFPSVQFAALDVSHSDLKHRPPNVEGTVFKTEQAAYLAGFVAARMAGTRPGPPVASYVAGYPIPPVRRFVAGFQAGARKADPKIKILGTYTNDFVNAAKCDRAALDQIARGSRVVFDVAGACGIGALKAAKRKGVWGVGVDIDQSYLGPFVLTSVIKHLDVAVYRFATRLRQGRFPTGGDLVFDLQDGAVGLGPFSPQVPAALRREVERLRGLLVQGRIDVPTTPR